MRNATPSLRTFRATRPGAAFARARRERRGLAIRAAAACCLLAFCGTAGLGTASAETKLYKWVDANGVTHYSDTPVDGAKKVDVPAAQSYSAPPPPRPAVSSSSAPATSAKSTPSEPLNGGYTRIAILRPSPDETFANVTNIDLGGEVEPDLLPGHEPWIVLDGKPIANATSVIWKTERGSHTVLLRIEDRSGKVIASLEPVLFHVQQRSVQTPPRGPTLQKPKKR